MADYQEIERALSYVAGNDDREIWVRMGSALKSELGEEGFDLWDQWSQTAANYDSKASKATWKSLRAGRVNIGSVFFEAKKGGFKPDSSQKRVMTQAEINRLASERKERELQAIQQRLAEGDAAKEVAKQLWDRGQPVNPDHPYLIKKGISDPLVLAALRQEGNNLLVPAKQNKEILAVQKINEHGGKYFGVNEMVNGSAFILGDPKKAKEEGLILAEGLATGATLHTATGKPVLIVFAAGNFVKVSEKLVNASYPIYLAADNDSHTKNAGLKFATRSKEILGEKAIIQIPEFTTEDIAAYQAKHGQLDSQGKERFPSDWNDYQELRGIESVKQALSDTSEKKSKEEPLLDTAETIVQAQETAMNIPNIPDYLNDIPDYDPYEQKINSIEPDLELIQEPIQNATQKKEEPIEAKTDAAEDKPHQTVKTEKHDPIIDHTYKAPPESLSSKYIFLADTGAYYDQNGRTTIFTDTGKKLTTSRHDPQTVHDMVEVAKAKGWTQLKLKGTPEFKRNIFLEAESQGIKTIGYEPKPEDLVLLKSITEERALNNIQGSDQPTKTVDPVKSPTTENKPAAEQEGPNDRQQLRDNQELSVLAASTANRIKAQNEMPSAAQVESSSAIDVDSNIPTSGVSSSVAIPSELKIATDQMAQVGSSAAIPKAANFAKLNTLTKMAIKVVSHVKEEYRENAIRNFDEHHEKILNGTAVPTIPALLQDKPPVNIREISQSQSQDLELER